LGSNWLVGIGLPFYHKSGYYENHHEKRRQSDSNEVKDEMAIKKLFFLNRNKVFAEFF
jgi:hypothetical protein